MPILMRMAVKKIKILHIVHSLEIGGLENGLVNLINRLDPERYEHAICCVATSGPMAQRLRRPVPIHELGKGNGGRAYLLPLRLAGVVRRVAPDIVHTRNWGAIDGVIGARLAGVRRVVHGEHGRGADDPCGTNRRRQQLRRLLAPAIRRFVTVSADLSQWLTSEVGVPEHKVTHIINGVDADRFRPLEEKFSRRRELELPTDMPLVGIVGRLDAVKDHATLLKAFATVPEAAILVVVGDGPLAGELRQLSTELGIFEKVLFLGGRNDVEQILPCLDLFVLSSIAEGISNTILEAMACGLPVIASNVGGNPELVADGVTGSLFAAGEVQALSQLMTRYLEDTSLRQKHGLAARQRIEVEFSLDAMVDKYDQLYQFVFSH